MVSRHRWVAALTCALVASCTEDPTAAVKDAGSFVFPELPAFDFGAPTPSELPTRIPDTSTKTCCDTDGACAAGEVCREGTGGDLAKRCVLAPTNGCWTVADCPTTGSYTCDGPVLCGCGGTCTDTEAPGVCTELVDVCCTDESDCAGGERCVGGPPGRCVPLPTGECFVDGDCGKGGVCTGSVTCACAEDCVITPGACEFPKRGECTIDAHCPGGRCMAGGVCGADCDPHDPTCCDDNRCVYVVPQCTSNADCPDGTCVAQEPCFDDCAPGDSTCCFGNLCQVNKCVGANPAGCLYVGCPIGEACRITGGCKPSSCECAPSVGWQCADDCAGGECVPSSCPGKNPGGCQPGGCPEGSLCKVSAEVCVPTSCNCDELTGTWTCTPDCGGGVCTPGF